MVIHGKTCFNEINRFNSHGKKKLKKVPGSQNDNTSIHQCTHDTKGDIQWKLEICYFQQDQSI